jgi:hypothetical protein
MGVVFASVVAISAFLLASNAALRRVLVVDYTSIEYASISRFGLTSRPLISMPSGARPGLGRAGSEPGGGSCSHLFS